MKIFNPFKAHVASMDGKYVIRRLNICCGWEYFDTFRNYWWCNAFVIQFWTDIVHTTLEDAINIFKKLNKVHSRFVK